MKTKFGNAKLDNKGYYKITSRKEGNNGEHLHRLIFEEFYGEIPEGYVVHHKNRNKLDNCILNLQLISDKEHRILHSTGKNNARYGKKASLETKIKISSGNSTGIYRVFKEKSKTCNQGYFWKYRYYDDGKTKAISSINIKKLKERVLAKGLDWIVLDEEKANLILNGVA